MNKAEAKEMEDAAHGILVDQLTFLTTRGSEIDLEWSEDKGVFNKWLARWKYNGKLYESRGVTPQMAIFRMLKGIL